MAADYRAQAQFSNDTESGHESDAVSLRGIVWFAVALVAMVIVSGAGMRMVMSAFFREAKDLRALTPPRFNDETGLFPAPRLQANPDVELDNLKQQELARLGGYGWVDKKAGVAHIPIDRAIDILARSGLPRVDVMPAELGGAAPATTPTKQEARPDSKQRPNP